MKLNGILIFYIITGVFILGVTGDIHAASGKGKIMLQKGDCIKCHEVVFDELKAGKSKHKSKVSCVDCHVGNHLPAGQKGDLIPECSQCHNDHPHFQLSNCKNCHQNPHKPLDIDLEGEGQKDTCGTCHPDLVEEINTHVTSHTGFSCSFCHKKHKDRPNCITCHEVHTEGQLFEDCIKCHQAHQPLTLKYDSGAIVNNDCGACHGDVQEKLESGRAKHSKFQCTFCHAEKHGVVPECLQCHQSPHDKKMIQNFKSCNKCHESAHDVLA